jgi:hypothetical protein
MRIPQSLLGGILCLLLLSWNAVASPAFAAIHNQTKPNLAATQSASPSQLPPLTATVTDLGTSHDSAGNACDDRKVSYGNIFAWVAMETYWCWNNVIVTYHSTTISGGVTTSGYVAGYAPQLNPQAYDFKCYAITSRNCSGNHEWTQQDYLSVPLLLEVDFAISEEEGYQGQFSYQTANHVCPGGC